MTSFARLRAEITCVRCARWNESLARCRSPKLPCSAKGRKPHREVDSRRLHTQHVVIRGLQKHSCCIYLYYKLLKNPFIDIDHVQLAMPPRQEPAARHFFVDLLGMIELPNPPALMKRGGCWFESGKVQIHLG